VPLTAYPQERRPLPDPDSCYGPARNFADTLMADWGIETTFYDPCVDEAGMAALIRPTPRCSIREPRLPHLRDAGHPALARAAHARGCKVLMDNTWGIHHFQPFQHGVDVSIQALTKYVGGHSDILLGSITNQ
jgi:cystathionine beta-lyase